MKYPRLAAIGATLLSVILAVYIGAVIYRAVFLSASGGPVGVIMALSLVVISLIAVWGLVREMWFGFQGTKLTNRLAAEGELPSGLVSTDASGRPNRAEALEVLPQFEDAVHADPESWRAWQRLGIMRRAAGNNAGARAAIRRAIKLAQQEEKAQSS